MEPTIVVSLLVGVALGALTAYSILSDRIEKLSFDVTAQTWFAAASNLETLFPTNEGADKEWCRDTAKHFRQAGDACMRTLDPKWPWKERGFCHPLREVRFVPKGEKATEPILEREAT